MRAWSNRKQIPKHIYICISITRRVVRMSKEQNLWKTIVIHYGNKFYYAMLKMCSSYVAFLLCMLYLFRKCCCIVPPRDFWDPAIQETSSHTFWLRTDIDIIIFIIIVSNCLMFICATEKTSRPSLCCTFLYPILICRRSCYMFLNKHRNGQYSSLMLFKYVI